MSLNIKKLSSNLFLFLNSDAKNFYEFWRSLTFKNLEVPKTNVWVEKRDKEQISLRISRAVLWKGRTIYIFWMVIAALGSRTSCGQWVSYSSITLVTISVHSFFYLNCAIRYFQSIEPSFSLKFTQSSEVYINKKNETLIYTVNEQWKVNKFHANEEFDNDKELFIICITFLQWLTMEEWVELWNRLRPGNSISASVSL